MDTEERGEIVSAGMDGEVGVETVLAAVQTDGYERWETYHLIRVSLNSGTAQELGSRLDDARRQTVHEALLQHRHGVVPTENPGTTEVRPLSRRAAANESFYKYFMVAASVLAVTVALWQVWPPDQHAAADMASTQQPADTEPVAVVQPKAAQALDDSTPTAALPTAASATAPGSGVGAVVTPAVAVQKGSGVRTDELPKVAP